MAEAEMWSGAMGRSWAENAAAMDRQLEPVSTVALAALEPQPGERILDLGCGAGATTAALAAAVGPQGGVTGVDISADQIAAARARPGCERAEFIVGDAQSWPFAPASHDALFSRFGGMFFGDPPTAYANLRRALKPGGRVVLAVWRAMKLNPWALVPASVAAELLGPVAPPPPGTPGPFAWAEPDYFAPILEGAGFTGTTWAEAPVMLQVGVPGDAPAVERAAAMLMRIGPLARRLTDQPPAVLATAARQLTRVLEPHVSDGWVRMPGVIWLIRARA